MSSDDIRRRMDLQTDKLIDRENIVIEDYYYLLTVYMKIKTFLETLELKWFYPEWISNSWIYYRKNISDKWLTISFNVL